MFRAEFSTLVIDTNILLLVLGYQCLESEKTVPLRRAEVLGDIRGRGDNLSPERFDDLWQVFRRARQRIVTQHVVAEVYGLRKRLPFHKDVIWRSAIEILMDPGLEEKPCSVRELSQEQGYEKILTELGPTDAGLLLTAERYRATVLTDDGPLFRRARERHILAIPLSQIGLT
jgi:rRNA-processing protein FCF1